MAPCLRGINRAFRSGGRFWNPAPKPFWCVPTSLLPRPACLLWVISSLLLSSGQSGAEPFDRGVPLQNDVMFVLDNSGSMKKVDPDFLLATVVERFIAARDEGTRVGVVIFDERARLLVPLTFIDSTLRTQLRALLDRLNYRGALSDLPGGVERALYELTSGGRRNVAKSVFVVTDGIVDMGGDAQVEKATGWLTGELAAQAAAEAIGIFGIALSEKADYRLLQSLAHITDADYFRARDVQAIAPILEQVTARLRYAARPESVEALRAPIAAATLPDMKETEATHLAPPAPEASPAPVADEPRLIVPLGEMGVWPDLVVAAGMPSRSFIWMGGAVALTLLAVFALVVWAVLQLGRERQTGKALRTAAPSPQEAVPRAFLYDLSGATESELHEVCNKVTVIGRLVSPGAGDASCGRLLLNDPTISRRHAIIEYSHHGFWLIDQRSRNGTYVGGKRVLEAVCLKHNDRITLSEIEFEFHIAAMDEAAETVLIPAR